MKRCPTCNGVVPQGHGRKSTTKYCSTKCYYERKMPPKNELLVMLNKTGSITTVADSLGAARINVHGWLKRYGIKRKVVFI